MVEVACDDIGDQGVPIGRDRSDGPRLRQAAHAGINSRVHAGVCPCIAATIRDHRARFAQAAIAELATRAVRVHVASVVVIRVVQRVDTAHGAEERDDRQETRSHHRITAVVTPATASTPRPMDTGCQILAADWSLVTVLRRSGGFSLPLFTALASLS